MVFMAGKVFPKLITPKYRLGFKLVNNFCALHNFLLTYVAIHFSIHIIYLLKFYVLSQGQHFAMPFNIPE